MQVQVREILILAVWIAIRRRGSAGR